MFAIRFALNQIMDQSYQTGRAELTSWEMINSHFSTCSEGNFCVCVRLFCLAVCVCRAALGGGIRPGKLLHAAHRPRPWPARGSAAA